MTPLERRLVKLENQTAASAKADVDREIETLMDLLSTHEIRDLLRLWREAGEHLTLQQLPTHPAAHEIISRSSARRESYARLWLAWDLRGSSPIVAHPWSAEAEIDALRNKVAMGWKRKGLALDLDALTPDDLTIINDLRANAHGKLGSWGSVLYIATPSEMEPLLARVWLAARATNRYECDRFGIPTVWEHVGRPLTWTDLELSPATFPWPVRHEWEQRTGRDSSWWTSHAGAATA